jgi:hypothetical protein
MQTVRPPFMPVPVQFNAAEIFQILTALEAQEEKGTLDPALQHLREKLNDALPFNAPHNKHAPESD